MTKEDFIKFAVLSGYGSRKSAEDYAKQHPEDDYTDKDFIELYYMSERWEHIASVKGLRPVHGINGKTTAMSNGIKGNSGVSQDWEC